MTKKEKMKKLRASRRAMREEIKKEIISRSKGIRNYKISFNNEKLKEIAKEYNLNRMASIYL